METVSFEMRGIHPKEWFIVALLTYIILSLMQQKIATHIEALEIAMKLEASPIGENVVNMTQIQT